MLDPVAALIRRHAPDFDSPNDIAVAVLSDLGHDPADLRDALRQVLPSYCATILRNDRNSAINARNTSDLSPTPAPVPTPPPPPVTPAPAPVPTPPEPITVSPKAARQRNWYKNFLNAKLKTEHGDWRTVSECTAEDLLYAAALRRSTAAKTLHRAAQYEALAEAITETGVKTVSELPEDKVKAAFDLLQPAA